MERKEALRGCEQRREQSRKKACTCEQSEKSEFVHVHGNVHGYCSRGKPLKINVF